METSIWTQKLFATEKARNTLVYGENCDPSKQYVTVHRCKYAPAVVLIVLLQLRSPYARVQKAYLTVRDRQGAD